MKLGLLSLFHLKGVNQMEITKIAIAGFRNISNLEINFDNSITSFVGLNGYGKSNVIDAIEFGFDFIHAPSQLHNSLMAVKNNIPILKTNAGQNYSFEFEIKLVSKEKEYYANYGFEFIWNTNKSPAKIVKEFLKVKENIKGQKYKSYISRNGNEAKYLPSETGRCDKKIKTDDISLVITKMMALDDLFYIDIVNNINGIQFFIEKHLDASPSYNPDPFVIKGFDELELNGIQSIPRTIYYLKKEHQNKYELLINAFKQLFPNIVDINIKELKASKKVNIPDDAPFVFNDNVFVILVEDKNLVQPIRFERLSDGTKRLFLMLTYAIMADIKGLSMIAVEEPENSIHPGLFQSYLDVLCQITKKCKIIINSHSPYIIQYLNPHSIYIGLPNDTGETDFRRIAATKVKTLLKDAAEYDDSIGDYIFNILSSSDSYDYLKEYLEKNA